MTENESKCIRFWDETGLKTKTDLVYYKTNVLSVIVKKRKEATVYEKQDVLIVFKQNVKQIYDSK